MLLGYYYLQKEPRCLVAMHLIIMKGQPDFYHIKVGFDGYSTLEIAGEEAVLKSFVFLKNLGAV